VIRCHGHHLQISYCQIACVLQQLWQISTELIMTSKSSKTGIKTTEKTQRIAESISEDICASTTKGVWNMCKHLLLGLSVHHWKCTVGNHAEQAWPLLFISSADGLRNSYGMSGWVSGLRSAISCSVSTALIMHTNWWLCKSVIQMLSISCELMDSA